MGLSRWRLPRLFCGNTTLIIPHYPMIKIILWEVSKQPIYSPGKIKINKFFSREKIYLFFFSFSHLTTVYQLRYIQCYQWLTPFFRPLPITKYLTCKGTLNVPQKLNSKSSLVIRGKQKNIISSHLVNVIHQIKNFSSKSSYCFYLFLFYLV